MINMDMQTPVADAKTISLKEMVPKNIHENGNVKITDVTTPGEYSRHLKLASTWKIPFVKITTCIAIPINKKGPLFLEARLDIAITIGIRIIWLNR